MLDKSGSISNTFIGAINLKNVNSYLDIHSGNHPGSFTLKTNSITNIGGTMNGLYNGNGNINLEVNGDVLNLGNIELIYNSGIQGISNGNASLKVTGLFKQTTGDFRGIFNLSSTNSGKINFEFEDIEITGGIFMAQYGCHTANDISNITINKNLTLDFTNSNAKFRGNGLNSLGGVNSNLRQQLIVKGNLLIKGNLAAEFTSSGSGGIESFEVVGTTTFEGCNSNFNYGVHTTTLELNGNVIVNGGEVNLSKTSGTLTAMFNGNLLIQSGQLNVKSETGNTNLVINGNYSQSGGAIYLYNNTTQGASHTIYMTVNGDYTNTSGKFNFDNNSSSTSKHVLSLNGDNFTIGGQAELSGSLNQQNLNFSTIYFDHQGVINYSENSSSTKIQNVKQVVSSGCTLKLVNGNMQAASLNFLVKDMIRVASNGILDAGNKQIYSNNIGLYSGINIDDQARIRTSHQDGLYNGAANATIRANGNMSFTLQPLSIVEYYGSSNQSITGSGIGTAQSADQQYGMLEINKEGAIAKLASSLVHVRTAMDLTNGELQLNGYNITIHSGSAQAVSHDEGYIKSETLASNSKSLLIWKNIEPGAHTIPFGINTEKLLPFVFTPISGFGNDFSVSTRSCSKDNRPLNPGVTNININNSDVSYNRVIDRWYYISAPGIIAHVTASYLPEENTTHSSLATNNFSLMNWNNSKWDIIGGNGNGTLLQTGNVSILNNSKWGNLLLISNEKLEQADILTFEAELNNKQVELSWTSLANVRVQNYIVERSLDGFSFTPLLDKQALVPNGSPITYKDIDLLPISGISYYRLRQNNPDGKIKYSQNVRIENISTKYKNLEFISAGPNPFSASFNLAFNVPAAGSIEIKLTSTNGQTAFQKKLNADEGKNTVEINELENMVPGVYILTLSDGKSFKNYKMFKI
ncbi:MAG: T9SS type A sorting domain-containing protein [Bacteroidetes bacterium]|nr:T9SS type A sorting domain-containing protein [Bacteroidota bacterium]